MTTVAQRNANSLNRGVTGPKGDEFNRNEQAKKMRQANFAMGSHPSDNMKMNVPGIAPQMPRGTELKKRA